MVNRFKKTYQSDLQEKDWLKIEPHIPKPSTKRGRKRKHTFLDIINGDRYITCWCNYGNCMKSNIDSEFIPIEIRIF
jgi:hypothetical protein